MELTLCDNLEPVLFEEIEIELYLQCLFPRCSICFVCSLSTQYEISNRPNYVAPEKHCVSSSYARKILSHTGEHKFYCNFNTFFCLR